jgi:hypothetical protein
VLPEVEVVLEVDLHPFKRKKRKRRVQVPVRVKRKFNQICDDQDDRVQ